MVENLKVSTRCGWMPHLRQIRATEANEIPSRSAISRVDQCVTPRWAGGLPLSANVSASTATSSITAARPGRGSSSSPSTPDCSYRSRHLSTVGRDVPVRSAISVLATPSAANNTIRALVANPA